MGICAIIYGVVEKIVDTIYWTLTAVLTVFELSVLAAMLCVCFVPFVCVIILFSVIWCILHPIYHCISRFFSKYGRYGKRRNRLTHAS